MIIWNNTKYSEGLERRRIETNIAPGLTLYNMYTSRQCSLYIRRRMDIKRLRHAGVVPNNKNKIFYTWKRGKSDLSKGPVDNGNRFYPYYVLYYIIYICIRVRPSFLKFSYFTVLMDRLRRDLHLNNFHTFFSYTFQSFFKYFYYNGVQMFDINVLL